MHRTLKGVCIAKSTQNLDVNILISKCWFIGVVPIERTKLRIQKFAFSHVFRLYFHKLFAKMQYFQSMLHAKLNTGTLKKFSTFKGKCAVLRTLYAIYRLAL